MEDQGTDVSFALYISVYAGSAKCICLELSEYFALLVRAHAGSKRRTQAASHRTSQAGGREEAPLPNSLPGSVCQAVRIAFQKVTLAFIL